MTSYVIGVSFYHSVDLELRVWCKPGLCGVNCEQPCDTDSYHSCMINRTTLLDTCSGNGQFLLMGFVMKTKGLLTTANIF